MDEAALRAHVRAQVEAGIRVLVPCGTTGEASTLDDAEWLQVVAVTCEVAAEFGAGQAAVFAGCTHNSTRAAVERVARISAVPGLTGVLTANPYYNRPGQEGQYQHFKAIAGATKLPVMLYNIPGRTGANLEPATVARLAEIENVVAIKESSGNMVQITELLTRVPQSFKVFAGDDSLALAALGVGAAGLISVASNVIPGEMARMVAAALGGDFVAAREINGRYFGLMLAHFWEASPAPVKAVMKMMGKGEETMRLPIVPVSDGARERLRGLVEGLGLV